MVTIRAEMLPSRKTRKKKGRSGEPQTLEKKVRRKKSRRRGGEPLGEGGCLVEKPIHPSVGNKKDKAPKRIKGWSRIKGRGQYLRTCRRGQQAVWISKGGRVK